MATEDELIGKFSLKPVAEDEESLVSRFGLKPVDAPEPITGPVGPSGGVLKPNVNEGVRVAKDLAQQQAAAAAAQQQQAAVQQQTDPREFSVSQTKKMFADMRKAQGGILSREQEAAEKLLLDIKSEELNAPAEMAAEERRIAEPYLKSLERSKKIEELAGQADQGPLGAALGVGAGAIQGGMGILESIFRTPDAVARGLSALDKAAKDSGNELFDRMIPDVIKQDRDKGFVTADIADQISIATKALPLLAPAFAKNEILGKQAEKATDEALKYAYTVGKEGNPHELFEVITNPHAWGGFIGQAAPSLFAAYKTRGSLGFLAWMEGMEVANDAADFEKMTGIKVDDAEFTKAAGQAAVINAILEKIAPDMMNKMKVGSTALYKLAQAPAIAGVEGVTESLQALNSNLSKRHFNEKQKITEGLLSSFMGGVGSGAGGAVLAASSGGPAAPAKPAIAPTAPTPQAAPVDETKPAPIATSEKQMLFDQYIEKPKDEKEAAENEYVRQNMEKVDAAYDEAVKTEYDTDTANVVAADLVKTMDVEGRPAFTAEQSQVRHEASSAFAKMKYDQLLKDPNTQQDPVMVLGGISGAGKTSSIKTLGVDTGDFAAVYDTNLTSKKTGERIVEKALGSNPDRQVVVTYVDRDPIRAFVDGVYKRFQSHKERRIVPIDVHVNNYKARKAIEELYQQYKDNPRVTFKFLDNNSGPGQVKEVTFENLPPVRYTPEEVKNELTQFIKDRIAAGDRISPQEAETFFGRYDQGTARGEDVPPLQEAPSTADEDRVVAQVGAKPAVEPTSSQTVPPVPGSQTIPDGKVRRFHVTSANPADISKSGLLMDKAKGIEGPKAIYSWASYEEAKRYAGDSPIVEFWDDASKYQNSPNARTGDVGASQIIAIHEPWHEEYRYLKENQTTDPIEKIASDKSFGDNINRAAQQILRENATRRPAPVVRGTPPPVRQNRRQEGTSRAFERVRNRLSEVSEEDPLTYNTVDLAEDTARALRFVEEFPDKAKRVALGLDPAPTGVTETAISIAYAEQMREEGKFDDMVDAEKSRSLRQTRRGQEIAAERGRANEHSASHFIQLIIRHRLENAGRDLFASVRGLYNKSESTSKKRAINRADRMAAVAKQQLDAKKLSIQEAQSIIDGLMC